MPVRRRLVLGSVALVLAAFIACTASIYLTTYRPLVGELTSLEMRRASEKVADDVQAIFTRVEAIAARNRVWGMIGVINLDDVPALNRLVGPLFQSSARVTSVAVAQDSGREVLIFSSPFEAGWSDRLTNPDAWGKEARFTTWNARGEPLSSEQREVDYDARQRPWFVAVMAQPRDDAVYWTPPYKFLSTQELGISAVVRWQTGDGHRYAMTTDIKLLDLTRLTQQIDVAKSGLAAVLTGDGAVLALPRDARFASSDAIRDALLKPVDALGIAPLASAFAAWQTAGHPRLGILTFDKDGAEWLATFWPIRLADQTLWVATLAPTADFGTVTGNTLALGTALVLGGLLIASLGAAWFGRRISGPIEQLTAASLRIGGMDLHHPIAVTSPVREIGALAQSLEQMRLNLARAQSVMEASTELERQAERALEESRELLLESQRFGKLGYVVADLVGGSCEVSESLIEMLDLPRRASYALDELAQLIHPDDLARLDEARVATAAGIEESTHEFRARHSGGAYRWFEGKRRLRVDDGGKPVAVLWVLLDVTERKAREEALRHSEERHRLILEHSSDGIAILRPDGTMVYRSPSMGSTALGYDDAEVVGRNLLERVHADDFGATRDAFVRLVATPGGSASGRARMRHANGSWRHLAWSARNAMDVAGIDGILVNWHDLTEVTRLQDQLQQAQKLEALGQLAGGIAHDFNNVLGAMLGFADFLVQDLPADSPQHRYAQSIIKAGHDARDLVAHILAFTRGGSVERKAYDLAQILHEAKDLLRGALPASTELVTELAIDGLVAEVNLAQMSQVMMNLCLNGSDALAGAAGRVTISLARLSPDRVDLELARGEEVDPAALAPAGRIVAGALDPTQAYARITVADNGPGMDDAVLARIFDPFFTTKEQGRGTGLGLVIVQSIVAAYGGACILTSRRGSGTRFSIYLPLKDIPAASASAEEVVPARGRGERVMVVDDDVSMAEMLTSGLERLGYKVVSLSDPRHALELFAERPKDWDVVISDQIMPHMTGTSLFEQLKAIRPSVCFILCTGFDAGATPDRARALGIAAWFPKPVLAQEISAAITRLTRKKKRARSGKSAPVDRRTADTDAAGGG